MSSAVGRYLDELVKGQGFNVQEHEGRGRCLFATHTPSGEPPVVLAEGPLGSIVQHSFGGAQRRRGLACSLCGHTLGSPLRQLRLLAKAPRSTENQCMLQESLSDVLLGAPVFSLRVPLLCSEACRSSHDRIFLRLRHGGCVAARRFARHARTTGCAFYLLALKLICWVLSEIEQGKSPKAAMAPLAVLFRRPYWEAVDAPAGAGKEEEHQFRMLLRKEVDRSRILARDAIGGEAIVRGLPQLVSDLVLTEQGYAGLVGALCCNAIAVVYVSPLVQHILQVDAMLPCSAREEAMEGLLPWLEKIIERKIILTNAGQDQQSSDSDGELPSANDERLLSWMTSHGKLEFSTEMFPSFKGYAVYPRLALANHSCRPNCAVEFTFDACLFLLAQHGVRILPGDEITISYLDASLGSSAAHEVMAVGKRRCLLQPYGFTCSCDLCISQDSTVHETAQCTDVSRSRKRPRS